MGLIIAGELTCTDGNGGAFKVVREPYRNLVRPVKAMAMLSGGRTGTASFGPILAGKAETACHEVSEDGMV